MNVLADVSLGLKLLGDLREDLPAIAKGLEDLKQAWADKTDPTKAATDLQTLITDNQPIIDQILSLIPATAPAVTPPAA